jgi:hypothetical protein
MKGILTSEDAQFPLGHVALIVVALVMGLWILRHAFTPVNDWLIILGAGFTLIALWSAYHIYDDLKRYVRYVRILRRIEREAREEAEED